MGFVGNAVGSVGRGLGVISNFQSSAPPIQTQDIISQINQVQGTPAAVENQQQQLAQALLQQSQGKGPNPAAIALQQQTDRNAKQAAGAMASQKGINPALAQRQIAQNEAGQQQQAAGQGALMQAQQQVGAQQQLGSTYNNIAGESLQNLGILENAQAAQNAAITQGSLGQQQLAQHQGQANATAMSGIYSGIAQGAGMAAGAAHGMHVPEHGGKVPAMVSPDELYLNPQAADQVKHEGANPLHVGEKIPGKAKVKGDSPKNDTVPRNLDPGGVVVPRTKAKDPDKAKEFIEKLKGSGEKKSPKHYGDVLAANRKLESRVAALEKRLHG